MSGLDKDDVEAIALRVAALLGAEARATGARYVDATELARRLGVERHWVYEHARELGSIRLGGARGRLRFDVDQAIATFREGRSARVHRRPSRSRSRLRGSGSLIPYEGEACPDAGQRSDPQSRESV
jgi:hypothetical protein